jgi:hypothetical protein
VPDDRTRRLDPERAELSGEGAGQERDHDHPGFPADRSSYYDRPVLKEPVWIWTVPTYFHVGGVAAGAAVLGAVAQVIDGGGLAGLVRRSREVAAVGGALGTALLVADLGRPERFLNMLRVFRPSSAMSVGSWTLAAASGATAGSALAPRVLPGRAGRLAGDAAGLVAGAVAPVLGTYTAVLVGDTAVPVWRATREQLPALFAASATASAAATLELCDLDDRETTIVHRLGIAARVAELAAGEATERAADRDERVGRPLREGLSGDLWRGGKALTAAGLLVSLLPLPRRFRAVVAGALTTLASLAVRFAVFQAGKASARDPHATFEPQRDREH